MNGYDAQTKALGFPPPIVLSNFDMDAVRADGRAEGYPECCIEAFVADLEADRYPAVLRGSIVDERGVEYVPCPHCQPLRLCPTCGEDHYGPRATCPRCDLHDGDEDLR